MHEKFDIHSTISNRTYGVKTASVGSESVEDATRRLNDLPPESDQWDKAKQRKVLDMIYTDTFLIDQLKKGVN